MAPVPTVEITTDTLRVKFPYDPTSVAKVKAIPRARWEPLSKTWVIPKTEIAMQALRRAFPDMMLRSRDDTKETARDEQSILEAAEKKYLCDVRDVKITDFDFVTPPYPHQVATFDFARSLDQSALFLEQGLGKSKVFIDLMTWRFRKKQVRRVLVVCPNSVTGTWVTEVGIHGAADFKWVEVLEGSTRDRIKQLEEIFASDRAGFVVVNYESLAFLKEAILKMQRSTIKVTGVSGPASALFQAIGLDESTRIKHAQAKRSQVAWHLGKTVRYRNILTGTPVTQNGEDLFSQYRFLKTEIFGPYATAFRGTYLVMGGFEMRQVVGYRNFSDFLKKVYSVAIRFTKDRCLNLPPKVYETRVAVLDEETSKRYRAFEKECVAEFCGAKISADLVMTKIMKLSQVTGGFIYEQGEDGKIRATHAFPKNPKLDVLEEILDESGTQKVIVWCRFKQEIKVISEMLARRKLKHVLIHGGVPPADRAEAVRSFQEDPETRVFLGQVSTAGLGITLTKASVVVYYSNTYALEDRLQSEDRCHRIGLDHSVTYIDILAQLSNGKHTVDHDVRSVLKGKSNFANEVSLALMSKMAERLELPAAEVIKRNPATVIPHSKNSDVLWGEAEEEF